jgi:hypothetical protein
MKISMWDCEKGVYRISHAKWAREIFRAPHHRKDPIFDNAEYLGVLSGLWPVYVCEISKLKEKRG